MTKVLIRICLAIANWLNDTPVRYGFINNIQAFDRTFLEATLKDEPDMTLRELLDMEKDWIPATTEHVQELNRELEQRSIIEHYTPQK